MSTSRKSIGTAIVAFALAIMMIAMGISTVASMDISGSSNGLQKMGKALKNATNYAASSNEIVQSINTLTKGIDNGKTRHNVRVALIMVIGILEICAGVMVLINFFLPGNLRSAKALFMWLVFVLWLIVLILVDITGTNGILGNAFNNLQTALAWLASLGLHCLILGAIIVTKED